MLSSASVQDILARFEATGYGLRRKGFIGFESKSSMDESELVAEKCPAVDPCRFGGEGHRQEGQGRLERPPQQGSLACVQTPQASARAQLLHVRSFCADHSVVAFPEQVAIQMNDTHPTLAVGSLLGPRSPAKSGLSLQHRAPPKAPELQRILVDVKGLGPVSPYMTRFELRGSLYLHFVAAAWQRHLPNVRAPRWKPIGYWEYLHEGSSPGL